MPDATTLWFGIVTGAIGMAYIVYGRKQVKFAPALAGIALCAYPYFVDGIVWLSVVGAVLIAVPFFVDF
jgi:hypothetical protein